MRYVKTFSVSNKHYQGLSEQWQVEVTYIGGGARDHFQGTMEECQTYMLRTMVKTGQSAKLTVDGVITAITEAPTEADAVTIMRMQSRAMVMAVADQLYVDPEGSLAIIRREIVAEARS